MVALLLDVSQTTLSQGVIMSSSATEHRIALVRTGADRLLTDAPELIRGRRIGILTNHTGTLADGRHIIDVIAESGIAHLTALYGPEHGIGGDTPDGEVVEHAMHSRYNVPVYSLYGRTHKPTKEMLSQINVLLCDIQDVGVRFYTFISTIALALEAAAECDIPVVILDRPNPIRGLHFDGPVRVDPLKSFVSWTPIPVTHGMTVGELARMWNEEGQLAGGKRVRLEVLSMEGWNRAMWFDETGLTWIPPSPNMKQLSTAIIYPGLCFVEGTSLSEGRGTSSPFELFGAPWMETERVLCELAVFSTPGVTFAVEDFLPREIPSVATEPKYEGIRCRGIRISIRDRDRVEPVKLGIAILAACKRAHPKKTELRMRRFDILTGTSSVRKALEQNVHPDDIAREWQDPLAAFGEIRSRYLMY
jgi:uncharacterized protein YbbC (DUF1343 family)